MHVKAGRYKHLDYEIAEREADYMRYTWLDEYLLSKKGVTKDLQKEWNWIRPKGIF